MSIRVNILFLAFVFATSNSIAEQAWSQELEKVRADYLSGPIQYAPDDPWVRSKVFQAHTGHSGFFYNCDGEECKRHSPYIHWTANCEPQWPQRRGLINGLRIDLEKIRRRINGGSCGCGDGATCQICTGQNQDVSQVPSVSHEQSVSSQVIVSEQVNVNEQLHGRQNWNVVSVKQSKPIRQSLKDK